MSDGVKVCEKCGNHAFQINGFTFAVSGRVRETAETISREAICCGCGHRQSEAWWDA